MFYDTEIGIWLMSLSHRIAAKQCHREPLQLGLVIRFLLQFSKAKPPRNYTKKPKCGPATWIAPDLGVLSSKTLSPSIIANLISLSLPAYQSPH